MHGVDAIYSTAPPPSAHLVAYALKGLSGLPWVADFRDLWTENPYRDAGVGPLRTRVERKLEASVLSKADTVLTISDVMRSSLGRGRTVPVHVIANGYEPREASLAPSPPRARFTVCFTGKFYTHEYAPFLEGLRRFVDAAALGPEDLEVKVFGASFAELRDPIRRSGLDTIVCVSPPVPHSQALQEQADASILLLVIDEIGGIEGRMTGKVFEYLQAKRPILAIVPSDSEVAGLVRTTGAGVVVDPTPDNVATALIDFYREFRVSGRVAWHGDQTRVEAYSRPKLARRLAEILDSLVEPRRDAREGPWEDEA
jgi:glycosyltransferase involved in cell wall biosynthesis